MRIMEYCKFGLIFLCLPWLVNAIIPFSIFWVTTVWFSVVDDGLIENIIAVGPSFGILLCYYIISTRVIASKENVASWFTIASEKSKSTFIRINIKPLLLTLPALASFLLPQLLGIIKILLHQKNEIIVDSPLLVIILLFISPIIEELFFRKALLEYCQKHMLKYYMLSSTLFFMLIHGFDLTLGSLFLVLMRLIFVPFLLVIPYLLTSSLLVPISIHAIWNISVFLVNRYQLFIPNHSIWILVIIYTLIIITISLYLLKKYKTFKPMALF